MITKPGGKVSGFRSSSGECPANAEVNNDTSNRRLWLAPEGKPVKLLVLVVVALAAFVGLGGIASADTRVVGDSLARQTFYESGGWYVNALNGRSLSESMILIRRTMNQHPQDNLVVALGSNDVSSESVSMASDVSVAASIPTVCTVITTVKVKGVTPLYSSSWKARSRQWNQAVKASGALVADWNAYSTGRPGWFLADGLHLTGAGKRAYNNLLRRTVQGCP